MQDLGEQVAKAEAAVTGVMADARRMQEITATMQEELRNLASNGQESGRMPTPRKLRKGEGDPQHDGDDRSDVEPQEPSPDNCRGLQSLPGPTSPRREWTSWTFRSFRR